MPKASELHIERPWLQWLLYGDSGAGKTSWAARSPMPFIIATERQAIPAIAIANPDAEVFLVNTYREVASILEAINKGAEVKLDDGQPALKFNDKAGNQYVIQTLIIDSLTDLHTRMADHFEVDKVDKKSLKRWGEVQTEMRRFLHKLRSLPVNVVCTALQETVGGGEGEPRRIVPAMHGRMSEQVGQYFSVVAYAFRNAKGQHAVSWRLGGGHITKPPATREPIPKTFQVELEKPGKTTLGTVLLKLYPNLTVSHTDSDSGDLLGS